MLDYGKRTLGELHDAWWEVHSPNLARATREAYEGAWEKLIEPRLGKLRLSEITPLALEQFMRSLLASGVGEASAEKAWVVLSSMLGRAEAWGWAARNPVRAASKPRKQNARRVPRPLTPIDIEAIRLQLGQPDATLVALLAYAGLRPGEALALQWGDIGEQAIHISRSVSFGEAKGTKTGARRRVPILAALRGDLNEWRMASGRPRDSALVFPGPDGRLWDDGRYRRWRRRVFKNALQAAELDPSTRVYDLRHAYASLMIKSGLNVVEVAARLGHSPSVCLDTYAHEFEELGAGTIDPEQAILAARLKLGAKQVLSRGLR
jgi:integrase